MMMYPGGISVEQFRRCVLLACALSMLGCNTTERSQLSPPTLTQGVLLVYGLTDNSVPPELSDIPDTIPAEMHQHYRVQMSNEHLLANLVALWRCYPDASVEERQAVEEIIRLQNQVNVGIRLLIENRDSDKDSPDVHAIREITTDIRAILKRLGGGVPSIRWECIHSRIEAAAREHEKSESKLE